MPWDGAGNFQRQVGAFTGDTLWEAIRDAGRDILAVDADAQGNDFKSGLENTLTRDGQNTPTADLPMGGHHHSGVSVATLRNQYAAYAQLLDLSYHAPPAQVGGTGDATTITTVPSYGSVPVGLRVSYVAKAANTGNVTLNISGTGPANVVWPSGTALAANAIATGDLVVAMFDGTEYLLMTGGEPVTAGLAPLYFLPAEVGESSNLYTITPTTALASYDRGQIIAFAAEATNSGAITVNVSALGAQKILAIDGMDFASGEIVDGQLIQAMYDGTDFRSILDHASAEPLDPRYFSPAEVAESSDVYTITASPALTSYRTGQVISFAAEATNGGAITCNINSLGSKKLLRDDGMDFAAGDIADGDTIVGVYDGTDFRTTSGAPPVTTVPEYNRYFLPAEVAESSDVYTITGNPAVAAYFKSMVISFAAEAANGGAITCNINSLGSKKILRNDGADFAAGDIASGDIISAMYDGTDFRSTQEAPNAAPPSVPEYNRYFVPAEVAVSSNVYTITGSPAVGAYFKSMVIGFAAEEANTGPVTLNINSLGSQKLLNKDGGDFAAADIADGDLLTAIYDGTDFRTEIAHPPVIPAVPEYNRYFLPAEVTVSNNVYTITGNPALAAYVKSMVIGFAAEEANTSAVTVNVNSLGSKKILNKDGADFVSGDIADGDLIMAVYDGTDFRTEIAHPPVIPVVPEYNRYFLPGEVAVSSNVYTITGSPAVAAYVKSMTISFAAKAVNTGAVTCNINSLGSKRILRDDGVVFASGDIATGDILLAVYDGSDFRATRQAPPIGTNRFFTATEVATSTQNYVITGAPPVTAYETGMVISFVAKLASIGSFNININGLGNRSVFGEEGTAPAAGTFNVGDLIMLVYDGTRFRTEKPDLQPIPPTWAQYFVPSQVAVSSNVYTITLGTTTDAPYNNGWQIGFAAKEANTGAITINVDLWGDQKILNQDGGDFVSGDIADGDTIIAMHDGTDYRTIIKHPPAGSTEYNRYFLPAEVAVSSNVYTITGSPALGAYAKSMIIAFAAEAANTGAVTCNINSLGSKKILNKDGADFVSGDIANGDLIVAMYDGTDFRTEIEHPPVIPTVPEYNRYFVPSEVAVSSNAYTITGNPAVAAYAKSMTIAFAAEAANTGAVTVNINSLGSKKILNKDGADFVSGDIANGDTIVAMYDGTDFRTEIAHPPSIPTVPEYNRYFVPGEVTVSSNAYTITGNPAVAAYAKSMTIGFAAEADNTDAITCNINSLGSKKILRDDGSDFASGDISSGDTIVAMYDGTDFRSVQSAPPAAVSYDKNAALTRMTSDTALTSSIANYLSTKITPSANSSIIRIRVGIGYASFPASNASAPYSIKNGNSTIMPTTGNQHTAGNDDDHNLTVITYYDAPNSTGEQTYHWATRKAGSSSGTIRLAYGSYMYLEEVVVGVAPDTNAVRTRLGSDASITTTRANFLSTSITPAASNSVIKITVGILLTDRAVNFNIRRGSTDISSPSGDVVAYHGWANVFSYFDAPNSTSQQTYHWRSQTNQFTATLKAGSYMYLEEIGVA